MIAICQELKDRNLVLYICHLAFMGISDVSYDAEHTHCSFFL